MAAIPEILLTYRQAAALIETHARNLLADHPSATESLPLLDALGRVLAHPLTSDRDQPPFPRSTRDGFACRAADLLATRHGQPLPIAGLLRAGEATTDLVLQPHQALEIMTGAPVPAGADAVVMLEHVLHEASSIGHETSAIRLAPGRSIEPGANIVPAGAEARKGSEVLPANLRLADRHIGAAAACGHATVEVYAQPRVAILATGDELVAIDAQPLPHQIRNSNSYSLAAQVLHAGAIPVLQPVAQDSPEALTASIRQALACDVLILSGGVSKGKYDFVKPALAALGAEFLLTGAEIQPGKPIVFGRVPAGNQQRYFFGLPGNPVSTLVTFLLFVRPLLSALGGDAATQPQFVAARLARDFHTKTGLTRFLPAILTAGFSAPPSVEPVAWRGSGDLAATAKSNCFFVVPPDREHLPAGTEVRALLA